MRACFNCCLLITNQVTEVLGYIQLSDFDFYQPTPKVQLSKLTKSHYILSNILVLANYNLIESNIESQIFFSYPSYFSLNRFCCPSLILTYQKATFGSLHVLPQRTKNHEQKRPQNMFVSVNHFLNHCCHRDFILSFHNL